MVNLRIVVATLALVTPAVASAEHSVAGDFAAAMSSETDGTELSKLVEFAPASTRIGSSDRARIQRLAKTWALASQQTVIEVHGYSNSLDLGIAVRRAELVRDLLVHAGIAPTRVTVVGHTLAAQGPRVDVSLGTCRGDQCAPELLPTTAALVEEIATVDEPRLAGIRSSIVAAPTAAAAPAIKSDATLAADRITLGATDSIGTKLTVETVVARISTVYMPNLKRCYELGMRTSGTPSRGTITLAFTVSATGALAKSSARGVSAEVDRCVSNAMTSWKFAIPRDASGDPTTQDLRISLAAK